MHILNLNKRVAYVTQKYSLDLPMLRKADAIIAGSTTLQMYTSDSIIIPTDLDIFFSDSGDDIDSIVDDLLGKGYILEGEKGIAKSEDYKFMGDIKKVVSLINVSKSLYVQLIVVEGNHRNFIVDRTDLSVTGMYYDIKKSCIVAGEGVVEDIKEGVMRIGGVYESVMSGAWGAARKEKLEGRIAKYEERGFRLVGCAPHDA